MSDAIVSSLREDLESALDTVAEEAPETAPPPTETETATTEEAPIEGASEAEAERVRKRDEQGRFAKEEAEKKAAAEAKKPAAPPAPGEETPAPEKPAAPSPSAAKPPQSWKPDAREEWSKLSPRVQQEVIRREGEVQRALQESSEARQGYQKYREAVAPFENMIRAEGGEVIPAIQGLLQTAHMLRTAPPQVRAAGIARMVQAFLPGREGLELLDAALSGQSPSSPQMMVQPQFQRDPEVQALLDQVKQAKEYRLQQDSQRAAQEIEAIKQEEFFEDVRQEMADLIEVANRRGLALSVKDAYNRACNLHPEISRVLAQRAAAQRTSPGATQRAKVAGSSVKSSPVVPPKGGEESNTDLRAALERTVSEIESGGR